MKTRNHVTILIDAEKVPDKMLHSRMIKTVDEPGMEADPDSGAKAGQPSPRPAPRDAARERRGAVPLRSGSTQTGRCSPSERTGKVKSGHLVFGEKRKNDKEAFERSRVQNHRSHLRPRLPTPPARPGQIWENLNTKRTTSLIAHKRSSNNESPSPPRSPALSDTPFLRSGARGTGPRRTGLFSP